MSELMALNVLMLHPSSGPKTTTVAIELTEAARERLEAIRDASGADDVHRVILCALFMYDQGFRASMKKRESRLHLGV